MLLAYFELSIGQLFLPYWKHSFCCHLLLCRSVCPLTYLFVVFIRATSMKAITISPSLNLTFGCLSQPRAILASRNLGEFLLPSHRPSLWIILSHPKQLRGSFSNVRDTQHFLPITLMVFPLVIGFFKSISISTWETNPFQNHPC